MSHRPRASRAYIVILASLASILIGSALLPTVTGQAQGERSFTAAIYQGTCDRLGGTVFQLADVAMPGTQGASPEAGGIIGLPSAAPVATSRATVDAPLDALVGAPHALAVGNDGDGASLACGGVGGVPTGENLYFGLSEQNGSGYAGIAELRRMDDGSTSVTILLAEGVVGVPASGTQAGDAATPAPDGEAAEAEAMTVEMVDIDFNPNEFSISANTDVIVKLPNNGEIVHNFNIDPLNVHSPDVPGGESTEVTINGEPGDYEYYCDIPGHREAGMVGTLHIE